MGQLSIGSGNSLTQWSTGNAEFGPHRFPSDDMVMVGVKCRIENFKQHQTAFLDTGAELPMIGGEIARRLENWPIARENVTMKTREGPMSGPVIRMTITLIADEGEDLPLESSVLLAQEWSGPAIILGYFGFLDRLRFALDPGLRPTDARIFYFGK